MSSGSEPRTLPGESEFERLLLESARDDELPAFEPALQRFHAALNLAAVGGGIGATKPALDAARRLAVRWALVGATAGSAATALVFGLAHNAEPLRTPPIASTTPAPGASSNASAAPARPPSEVASAPPSTEAALPAPIVKRRGGKTRPEAVPVPTAESTLLAEVALLDSVRETLLRHDGDQALRLLTSYEQRFPKGQLARDAAALTIEALAAQGKRAEVEQRAATFLEDSPDDPQAARVRSLQRR